METGVSASLIPHEAIVPQRPRARGGIEDIAFLFTLVCLIASIGLAGGVYFYAQYIYMQLESRKSSIENQRKTLDPNTIEHLVKFNTRLDAAQSLMSHHIAPTVLFTALGSSTLQSVYFDGIQYDATDPQKITITMNGTAQTMNAVALQAQIFAKNEVIRNPIFSGVNRGEKGVKFSVKAEINSHALNYQNLVGGSQVPQLSAPVPQVQTVPPSPFGTPSQ